MVMPTEALPGREQPAFTVPERHAVLGTSLKPPFPEGMSTAVFGLGCFWGAERKFWQIDGVYTTAVGYAGGFTPNPTYEQALRGAGYGPITTEIAPAGPFYYAEDYHQQYLHKVPNGYCGLGGTGVSCPVGLGMGATRDEVPRTDEEWRKRLSTEQYAVLREAATERPFSGKYVDTDEDGFYHCAACGNLLFDGRAKYHSGTGWPSFTETVSPDAVELVDDSSHGMVRTEVRCARCHSHLGHVFDDGPREAGGRRWCMNSDALDLEQR